MKTSNFYVKEAIKDFWNKTFPQDVVVFFRQKYEHEVGWSEHKEVVLCQYSYDDPYIEFLNDFCEGQTCAEIISIVPLEDVLNFYKNYLNFNNCINSLA